MIIPMPERSHTLRHVLASAARLQQVVPDAVLVGGSAAALHAGHRDSFDHDHVLVDLVVLIMDLLHQEQCAAAQRLLSGYLGRAADAAGTALLPLFLAARATIRAKIAGFEARDRSHGAVARDIRERKRAEAELRRRALRG